MRKFLSNQILLVVLFALITILLPTLFVEKMREGAIHLFRPLWKTLSFDKPWRKSERRLEIAIKKLELENQLLQENLNRRKFSDEELAESKNFLLDLTDQKIKVATAHIIFRDPKSWGSSLWVNVGEETNERAHEKVIQKNSPVLAGRSVVGLVDYVGRNASRVRLITDSAVKPSVQVARGNLPRKRLSDTLSDLIVSMNKAENLPLTPDEKSTFMKTLSSLNSKVEKSGWACYPARGILQGTSPSLFHSKKAKLKGSCFHGEKEEIAPINEGDLLVTSGMDGVFPANLPVAIVTKVFPLREGECMYDIEAVSCIKEMDSLTTLFILPSFETDGAFCDTPKG